MNKSVLLTVTVALTAACVASPTAHASEPILWISSTSEKPWQQMSPPPHVSRSNSPDAPQVRVVRRKTYQTIEGFGGCVNDLSWVALGKATAADQKQVVSALFGNDGCAFTLARIPIGASDFSLDAYSLDDTAGDTALRNFSIDRDKKHLVPFIKAAMNVRPALKCWASPWSPPAWMKTNNSYSKGSLRWEPDILHSYANYMTRWVDAYRGAGINIYALTPQNEPNILSDYPSCLWTGPQLREFIADYLGPTLRARKTNVELWLGLNGDPFNGGDNINDRFATVLNDPKANALITGVGFQYDSRNQISAASQWYSDKKFMQSETECRNGANSWEDAQHLYGLMKRYIEGGASAYFAWNMVLDETGMSTWKWKQNAPITVNSGTGKVTYNGEFYVMRHFSQYVKPGAKRVLTTGVWGDKIAFVNPDGSAVLIVGNSAKQSSDVTLSVDGIDGGRARSNGSTFKATLPPESINTFIVKSL